MKLSAAVFEAIEKLKQSENQWEDVPATLPDGTPTTVRAIRDGKYISVDLVDQFGTYCLEYSIPRDYSEQERRRIEHRADVTYPLEFERDRLRLQNAAANRRIREIEDILSGQMISLVMQVERPGLCDQNQKLLASAGF